MNDNNVKLYILENRCREIQNAIESLAQSLPSQISFIREFRQLENRGDVSSILELLHTCWCWANPLFLFDKPSKDFENLDEMFRTIRNGDPSDFGRDDWTLGMMKHYKVSVQQPYLFRNYNTYLNNLYFAITPHCQELGLQLRNDFTFSIGLPTNLTTTQLNALFDVAVSETLVWEKDREKWLSLFNNTITATSGPIEWRDISKTRDQDHNHIPGYASLYTFIKCAVGTINKDILAVVSQRFVDCHGKPIASDKIKSRKGSSQERLSAMFSEAILSSAAGK